MTFTHLRQLGDGYEDEQGKEGHDRRYALGGLEKTLLSLYVHSDRARAAARTTEVATNLPTGAGRVRALAAFHMQQQQKSTAEDRLNQRIIQFRQWLHRQNARLTPDGRIDWSRSATRVEYDNDVRKQSMSRVTVRGGLLVTADGKPLDTSKMVTMHSGPGNAIYVMSPDGYIHVSSHSVGYRHHSSLLAGAQVAGAGEMRVTQGRIVWLSNKSGHYQPPAINLLQTIVALTRQGYSDQYVVHCKTPDGQVNFPNIQAFCTHHGYTDTVIRSLDLIVAFEASQRENHAYSKPSDLASSQYTLYSNYTYVPRQPVASTSYYYSKELAYPQYALYSGSGQQPPSVPTGGSDGDDASQYTYYAYTPVAAPASSSPSSYAAYAPPVPDAPQYGEYIATT